MKRLLLDTHAFLWWLADDPRFGELARREVADTENQVLVGAISIQESVGLGPFAQRKWEKRSIFHRFFVA